MIVTFDKEPLRDLFEKGKTKDKQYRFQPDVIKRYKKRIAVLEKAERIEDLFAIGSLNYEVLQGNKQGISSIRVNDRYRIEFTVKAGAVEPVITVCNILELSNHYQ